MSKIINNINEFENSLKQEKLSADTIKNYLSDTNHFKVWAADNKIKVLNKQNILRYISYLKMKKVSDSSINRKLATLRRLAKFLNEDFMAEIKNAGITNKFTKRHKT
jgi:site-specific recombinase XerD